MPERKEVFEEGWAPSISNAVAESSRESVKNVGENKSPEDGGGEKNKSNYKSAIPSLLVGSSATDDRSNGTRK